MMDENGADLFSWFDYILFTAMLGISVAIGIYFGFFGKKQNSADEYLKGGKRMQVVPIAISLIASQISTTTLLAVPADVYRFGSNYAWVSLATIFHCIIAYYVYLPVFFNLQVTSIYEYVELRFDKKLRLLTSFFNVMQSLIYCPIVVYIPSIAFSRVTGVSVHVIALITSAICIFYTTVGGLKAVVWTDTLQFFVMISTFIAIYLIGLSAVGGFGFVWEKSVEGHRLDVFDFSFDPTLRDSFGALVIGGTVQWLTYTAIFQGAVQKIMAVPSYKDVRKIVPLYAVGMALFHIFATLSGLLLYGRYWNCDPLITKEVAHAEQLLPHFVMEVARNIPGLPGVFIAGVYSAGLSSLSATLNTLSAIVYQDFLSPFIPKNTSQKRVSNILKLIVLVGGIFSTFFVFALEKLEGIFALYTASVALFLGSALGIFTLGMLIPKANSKGAFVGAITSCIVVGWIVVQNQKYQSFIIGEFKKPTSTEGCNMTSTLSYEITTEMSRGKVDAPFVLYRLSFWLFSTIGLVVTIIIGVIVSVLTKHDKKTLPSKLLSPVIRSFVKGSKFIDFSEVSSDADGELDARAALMEKKKIIHE